MNVINYHKASYYLEEMVYWFVPANIIHFIIHFITGLEPLVIALPPQHAYFTAYLQIDYSCP